MLYRNLLFESFVPIKQKMTMTTRHGPIKRISKEFETFLFSNFLIFECSFLALAVHNKNQ